MKSSRSIRAGMGFTLGVLALLASPGSFAAARDAQPSIAVTRADTLAGASFEIVGRVFEKTRDPRMTETNQQLEDRSSQGLVAKARTLGANAVLGMHGLPSDPDSHPRWVSGVAVRVLESGDAVARRAAFIVAVLPIAISDSLVEKPRDRLELALALQDQACSVMETHGYYARASSLAPADTGVLAAMSDSLWNANFGAWTENVLVLSLERSSTSHRLTEVRRETTLDAWMYSRAAGRVVWRRGAVGSAGNWKAHAPDTGEQEMKRSGFIVPHTAQDWGAGFAGKEEVLEKSLANAVARVLEDVPRTSP